jgi:hypothetical protein
MSDNRLRDLERKALSGDTDASSQLAGEAARARRSDLVYTGVVGALPAMSMDELKKLGRVVMEELSKKEDADMKAFPDLYKDVKAGEIHMPTLGKISLAKLVSVCEGLVGDCLNGKADSNPNLQEIRGNYGYGYNRRRRGGKTKSQHAKQAEKAFSMVNGDFLVSCSGALRVYALQKQPSAEELEARKATVMKRKLTEELVSKQAEIAKANEQAKKAAEKLKKIQDRLKKLGIDED